MQYSIHHETFCRFDNLATYSIRNLRLTPREEAGQRIERWQVSTPVRSTRSIDAWGNTAHLLTLTEPHDEVRIMVSGVIETAEAVEPFVAHDPADVSPFAFMSGTHLTQSSEEIQTFAREHLQDVSARGMPRILKALTTTVVEDPGADTVGSVDAFARRQGNLQDLVHIFIAACRCQGVPVRFVSGFLLGECSTVHVWADVWLAREHAWFSVDLQRACPADGRLVRLAVGRDYLDACPMRTAHQGGGHEEVEVFVQAA